MKGCPAASGRVHTLLSLSSETTCVKELLSVLCCYFKSCCIMYCTCRLRSVSDEEKVNPITPTSMLFHNPFILVITSSISADMIIDSNRKGDVLLMR